MHGDDDDDGDEDLLCKQAVERGNFDADLPRLLRVAVDLDMTRTTRNPDWCSSDHSPRRLSLWWSRSRGERHPSESRSLEAAYWTMCPNRRLGNSRKTMKNMAPLQSGGSNELELPLGKEAQTRDRRRMKAGDDDDGDDFLDPRTHS